MIPPEILIPFSLPPPEHAKDLVKMLASECGPDGLAMLLSRYQSLVRTQFDDFSPALPHETWLASWLHNQQNSLLQYHANLAGLNLNPGYWFLLHPVHLHIARSHLLLTDYRQLALSAQEATQLVEKAKLLCNEAGIELVYGSATTWFLRADDWSDFITSSPDAACGHNIDIWSARGTKEFAWRKLQNEIQMEWFIHPLQQQREQRGEKMINGLWLWSGTALPTGFKANSADQTRSIISSPGAADFANRFSLRPQLILLDQLSSAALSNDWGTWAALMIELEHSWFKPLCAALDQRNPFNQCKLYLSNSNTLLSIENSSNALRKFWRTSTFKQLMT